MKVIGFGVFLLACGIYWKIYEDVFNLYIMRYVYDRTDSYWLTSDLLWHLFPWMLMIVAVIVLLSGIRGRSSSTVVVSSK